MEPRRLQHNPYSGRYSSARGAQLTQGSFSPPLHLGPSSVLIPGLVFLRLSLRGCLSHYHCPVLSHLSPDLHHNPCLIPLPSASMPPAFLSLSPSLSLPGPHPHPCSAQVHASPLSPSPSLPSLPMAPGSNRPLSSTFPPRLHLRACLCLVPSSPCLSPSPLLTHVPVPGSALPGARLPPPPSAASSVPAGRDLAGGGAEGLLDRNNSVIGTN